MNYCWYYQQSFPNGPSLAYRSNTKTAWKMPNTQPYNPNYNDPMITPENYPGPLDPLYNANFLPEPIDFTDLMYVSSSSKILINALFFFKAEPFADKECQFTSCTAFENGCTSSKSTQHVKIRSQNSPVKTYAASPTLIQSGQQCGT
jgi:hypothetical protein